MRIIIVGCGKIGTSIIASLVEEGNDVVAIDNSPSVIEEVGNTYDVITVCGNGADTDTLKEAGVAKADLFVAVADSDEFNMLSCFVAERMGAKNTIARIRKPEYNDDSLDFLRKQLKLAVSINPEWMAAKELFNILRLPAAVNIENFSRGNLEMVQIKLKQDSIMDNLTLIDMRRQFKAKFLICAVKRGEEVYVPGGHFVLKSGDTIGITAASSETQKLLKTLGQDQKSAKNVMILGASRIAYYLTKRLIASGSRVVVIDKDENCCREFSENLPEAVVIHGDGARQELLLEEGLETMDAFVALTGMDELNILVSIFANSKNIPKVITKVNSNELSALARNLGLDSIISTKSIVSNVLSSYARALQNTVGSNVETLYKLMGSGVEALEFKVSQDFKGANIPLKELSLKENTLLAGIIRGRKAIIPTGDDMIQYGDRVVVISSSEEPLLDLSDILR